MPAVSRPPRRSPYRRLPLWAQWAIPFGIAGGLILALVLWVQYESNTAPLIAPVVNPKAVAEQNREARILVGQDQAPHVAQMSSGDRPAAAIRAAVVTYMAGKISHGVITGPLTSAHCGPVGAASTSTRLVFRCGVKAASVNYPFEGVVDPSAHQITYCKRDPPPVPSMKIPLSTRCT